MTDSGAFRQLRLAAGLNPTELAQLLGVGRTAVTGWEVGRNPIPAAVTERLRAAEQDGTLQAARDPERPVLKDWDPIVARAAEIVEASDVGMTLRQCFYRLVSEGRLPNTLSVYQMLSMYTAKARRAELMGDFLDQTRSIERPTSFTSPAEARAWLQQIYRRDRTEGQRVSLYLGVEKHGTLPQLQSWFEDLGVPIIPLGGYGSQTFKEEVRRDAEEQDRPAVLVYAGDFDPTGEDIIRDFVEKVGEFDQVIRVALTADQVEAMALPKMPGKATDPRANGFIAKHGELVHVEIEALPPATLRDLYQAAITQFWDPVAFAAVLNQETTERASLVPSVRRVRRRPEAEG